jgi:hypothetical protein
MFVLKFSNGALFIKKTARIWATQTSGAQHDARACQIALCQLRLQKSSTPFSFRFDIRPFSRERTNDFQLKHRGGTGGMETHNRCLRSK